MEREKMWHPFHQNGVGKDKRGLHESQAYLEGPVGCTAFRNVCAVTKDLAKYNNMTLGGLFQKYQG